MTTFNIVAYCAAEVTRQQDTPMHVAYMYQAWSFLHNVSPTEIDAVLIRLLGTYVQGPTGYLSWRVGPAVFNQGVPALDYQHIPRQIELLCEAQDRLTPEEFVFQFLKIHPFSDGNGRVASLLYNLLRGTLDDPVPLPEFDFTKGGI